MIEEIDMFFFFSSFYLTLICLENQNEQTSSFSPHSSYSLSMELHANSQPNQLNTVQILDYSDSDRTS